MKDHRIRLTDQDLAQIVAALSARKAAVGEERNHELDRLIERLSDLGRGNPKLRFDEESQEHWELEDRPRRRRRRDDIVP